MAKDRKWLPSFAELIDRLSIHQLKEVFIKEHKDKYFLEMQDIIHDLDILVEEGDIPLTGDILRTVIIISQINAHIWYNESKARKGESQDLHLLRLTHGLNGIRNRAGNHLLYLIGQNDRQDWKTDCLAEEFKDWDIKFGVNNESATDRP
jgi:hypothetical protein